MSIIFRIKQSIPFSGEEPKSNLTPQDFRTEDSDNNSQSNEDSNQQSLTDFETEDEDSPSSDNQDRNEGEKPQNSHQNGQSNGPENSADANDENESDEETSSSEDNDSSRSPGSADNQNENQQNPESTESANTEETDQDKPTPSEQADETEDETQDQSTENEGSNDESSQHKKETEQDDDDTENEESSPENGQSTEGSSQQSEEIEPDDNEPDSPTAKEGYEPDPDLVDRDKQKLEREKRQQRRQQENLERELNQLKNALENSGGDGLSSTLYNTDPSPSVDQNRWKNAQKGKGDILYFFQQNLDNDAAYRRVRGRPNGSPDVNQLSQLKAKQTNIMESHKPNDEKEYSVVILLDRSFSMNGDRITFAEEALVKFALALEDDELGTKMDVCIIDMCDNEARFVKPFNIPIEDVKGDLLTKETGGTTPLSDALEVAREHLIYNGDSDSFIISITDGEPDNPDTYQNELKQCPMPVLGVTIKPGATTDASIPVDSKYYDIHKLVSSESELVDQLISLTMEVDHLQI